MAALTDESIAVVNTARVGHVYKRSSDELWEDLNLCPYHVDSTKFF